MNEFIKSIFTDRKQSRLFILLCLATAFCFTLIAVRMHFMGIYIDDLSSKEDYFALRGTPTFLFLVWNLFLAWIPYLISLGIDSFHDRFHSKAATALVLISWLLFLPNAPYILTDLLHLKSRSPIPHWYDMMLILSFAWTGLMLGFLSLHRVQHFMIRWISKQWSWVITIAIIGLTGFGVYLGRFLRWNSWDILSNPLGLGKDIADIILHPLQYGGPLGISAVISFFLLLVYLQITALVER